MNACEMGTTGLQEWVNESPNLSEFRERRREAEGIISRRLGSFSAMIFVEKLCNDGPAARREYATQQEDWKRTVKHAREWAVIVKDDLLAGRPISIKPARTHTHVLEMAFNIATGQCDYSATFGKEAL